VINDSKAILLAENGSGQLHKISTKKVTGVNFYEDVLEQTEKKRLKTIQRKGIRNGGVLLLSNYRPKDFGNAKIDLTCDGG